MSSTEDGGADVLHVPEESRFVARADGSEAELVYARRGDRMFLVHTGVPEALGGRGIGGQLVSAALHLAAEEGLVVVPWCPFARRFLRRHPAAAAGVTLDWSEPPEDAGARPPRRAGQAGLEGRLDEEELESFPASDSHSDWAGPGS